MHSHPMPPSGNFTFFLLLLTSSFGGGLSGTTGGGTGGSSRATRANVGQELLDVLALESLQKSPNVSHPSNIQNCRNQ